MTDLDSVLPKGSWILITGATGFLASRTIIQFLERGYKVRATTREASEASWVSGLLPEYTKAGSFELVSVPDHDAPDAFRDVIKGISAVVHIAVVFNLDPDPNHTLPAGNVRIQSMLRAAAAEPSVKRFVYTSSSFAHVMPQPGTRAIITKDTYNELAIKEAWAPPPYDLSRIISIYFAGKAETEKTIWKFVADEKPPFIVNVVSPYMMTGKLLSEKQMTSSLPPQLLDQLYRGDLSMLQAQPAFIYCDVQDAAAVHVAAALDPTIEGQRIQVWAGSRNWADVLDIFRKAYPEHQFVDEVPGAAGAEMLYTAEPDLAHGIIKKWTGRDWISFEQSVREAMDSILVFKQQ